MKTTLLLVRHPESGSYGETATICSENGLIFLGFPSDSRMKLLEATPADLAEALFGGNAAETLERAGRSCMANSLPGGEHEEVAAKLLDAARRVRESEGG